jgi:cell wall-associated NlpC family hydrolase
MRKGRALLYPYLMALAASFLLGSCHSGKKATKSSATTTNQSKYTSEADDPPGDKPKRKRKKAPSNEKAEKENGIVSKYADKLDVSKRDITNYELYKFIDTWYGAPYKYAGRTKAGVDCSDLVSILYQNVYNVTVTGNVETFYKLCKPIKPSELKEGDLIFFKINSKSLSHIGVYLQNHRFVHASVHSGVVIDDLGEDYYKKYYWGAGRLLK